MAVTLGNTSNGVSSGAVTTLTVAHTLASSSDNALFVVTYSRGQTLTATYNGNAMTERTKNQFQGNIYLFSITGQDSGSAHNTVVTAGAGTELGINAVDFYNVDQTTPLADVGNAGSVTTSISASVTTADDNSYIVGGAIGEPTSQVISETSGQTAFGLQTVETRCKMEGGYEAIATASSQSMSWGLSTSNVGMIVVGAVAEVASATPVNLKTFNTVAAASVKTLDSVAKASVKTINTVV